MGNKIQKSELRSLILQQGTSFMRQLTITKRNSKYCIRPTINGRQYFIQFNTEEEAKEFLSVLPPATTNKSKKYFADYFFLVINQIEKDGTKFVYYYSKKYWESIMKKTLADISYGDLKDAFTSCPKGSWGSLKGVLIRISKISDEPSFNTLIDRIKYEFVYKSKRREVQNAEEVFEKFRNLVPEGKIERKHQLTFLIMCLTGLRIGELSALTKEDFEQEYLEINKTTVPGFSFSETSASRKQKIQHATKTGVDRVVPIVEEVRAYAKELYSIKAYKTFPSLGQINNYLAVFSERLGIKQNISCHSARHIFGTVYGKNCKTIGEALKLQKLLGHSSFKTTERYITISNPSKDDISDKLSGILGGTKNKTGR